MPNRPSVSARDMIAAVDKLCAENAGVFPAPRAVRDEAEGGSQARAESAILTVQIRQGMTPHLRGTLPADFQAELPPVSAITSLAPAVLADLPCQAQTLAEQFFAALGVAFKKQVDEVRGLYDAAVASFVEQTAAMHDRLMVAARHADDQERSAREEANRHAAERSELREGLAGMQSEVRAAERELALHKATSETALADGREAKRASDEKHDKEIDRLTRELAQERSECRAAERAVSSLTTANEALREENARLAAELVTWRERATAPAPARRNREKTAAR
jgi:hypothetical protein